MVRGVIAVVVLGAAACVGWNWYASSQLATGTPDRLPLAEPGVEGSVLRLFRATEGDGADAASIDSWVARYRDGEPLSAVAEALAAGPRFTATYGSLDDRDFVEALFDNLLGRAPSATERRHWAGELERGVSRATVLATVTESSAYVARTRTPAPLPPRPMLAPAGVEHSIARLYLAFHGRWPDRAALDDDVRQYLDGTPLPAIAEEVLAQPDATEYRRARSDVFVKALYSEVLGRAPEPAGLTRSRARLEAGESKGAIAVEFTESAEMLTRTRTAAPLPAPIPHKLFAVGDSVMLGAVEEIAAIPGWSVHVDARGCRQPTWRGDGCGAVDIPSGIDALRAAREAGHLGGAVVIHLGNNGPMSAEQFDALMAEVADQRLVFAVTLREPRSYEGPNNAVIAEATARWPNLRILDWHTFATPNDFGDGEGIHLSHTGARSLTSLITAALPNY
jgi:hypothetical protein